MNAGQSAFGGQLSSVKVVGESWVMAAVKLVSVGPFGPGGELTAGVPGGQIGGQVSV